MSKTVVTITYPDYAPDKVECDRLAEDLSRVAEGYGETMYTVDITVEREEP